MLNQTISLKDLEEFKDSVCIFSTNEDKDIVTFKEKFNNLFKKDVTYSKSLATKTDAGLLIINLNDFNVMKVNGTIKAYDCPLLVIYTNEIKLEKLKEVILKNILILNIDTFEVIDITENVSKNLYEKELRDKEKLQELNMENNKIIEPYTENKEAIEKNESEEETEFSFVLKEEEQKVSPFIFNIEEPEENTINKPSEQPLFVFSFEDNENNEEVLEDKNELKIEEQLEVKNNNEIDILENEPEGNELEDFSNLEEIINEKNIGFNEDAKNEKPEVLKEKIKEKLRKTDIVKEETENIETKEDIDEKFGILNKKTTNICVYSKNIDNDLKVFKQKFPNLFGEKTVFYNSLQSKNNAELVLVNLDDFNLMKANGFIKAYDSKVVVLYSDDTKLSKFRTCVLKDVLVINKNTFEIIDLSKNIEENIENKKIKDEELRKKHEEKEKLERLEKLKKIKDGIAKAEKEEKVKDEEKVENEKENKENETNEEPVILKEERLTKIDEIKELTPENKKPVIDIQENIEESKKDFSNRFYSLLDSKNINGNIYCFSAEINVIDTLREIFKEDIIIKTGLDFNYKEKTFLYFIDSNFTGTERIADFINRNDFPCVVFGRRLSILEKIQKKTNKDIFIIEKPIVLSKEELEDRLAMYINKFKKDYPILSTTTAKFEENKDNLRERRRILDKDREYLVERELKNKRSIEENNLTDIPIKKQTMEERREERRRMNEERHAEIETRKRREALEKPNKTVESQKNLIRETNKRSDKAISLNYLYDKMGLTEIIAFKSMLNKAIYTFNDGTVIKYMPSGYLIEHRIKRLTEKGLTPLQVDNALKKLEESDLKFQQRALKQVEKIKEEKALREKENIETQVMEESSSIIKEELLENSVLKGLVSSIKETMKEIKTEVFDNFEEFFKLYKTSKYDAITVFKDCDFTNGIPDGVKLIPLITKVVKEKVSEVKAEVSKTISQVAEKTEKIITEKKNLFPKRIAKPVSIDVEEPKEEEPFSYFKIELEREKPDNSTLKHSNLVHKYRKVASEEDETKNKNNISIKNVKHKESDVTLSDINKKLPSSNLLERYNYSTFEAEEREKEEKKKDKPIISKKRIGANTNKKEK